MLYVYIIYIMLIMNNSVFLILNLYERECFL